MPIDGLREVVRHVPAARGDVGRLRHAVQEDLLGRQPGGEAGRQVAVVGKEVVTSGAEGQAERELDGVVAGAGRVVAPAEALLEVVRGLVVEHAPEVHERVPLLDLFARDAGEARFARRLGEVLGFGQTSPPWRPRVRSGRPAFYRQGQNASKAARIPRVPVIIFAMSSRQRRDPAAGREESLRREMVARFVAPRGVDDPRVLEAMSEVPRHLFVPEPLRARAYGDHSLPIGYGQTISQPYVVGVMTQRLGHLDGAQGPRDRVRLRIPDGGSRPARPQRLLAGADRRARAVGGRATLASLGFHNVSVKCFDGTYGYPAAAPYDRILVTAGDRDGARAAARAARRRRAPGRADRPGRQAAPARHPAAQDRLRPGGGRGRDVRAAARPLRGKPRVMARRAVVRGTVQGVGLPLLRRAQRPRARSSRLGPQPSGRIGRDPSRRATRPRSRST